MAFTAAYDGARRAFAAVLAIEGLRVRPVGGAHRNTRMAAAAFVDDESLEEFDWMRQVRNATEYPDDDRPTATKPGRGGDHHGSRDRRGEGSALCRGQ